ncbi:hypothetical protein [Rhodothermus profundi]|uniref:PH domain-containing protein n=1 Tax=Rhodothermus profundi TaxID=633813 RepID=A0A1M6RDX5_9BACT|nr:hypothetical protein [Rhodothermus profundi]SHK30674.1 hypothetical protein SAMN04488087_0808 [Rhodothermus profundi]
MNAMAELLRTLHGVLPVCFFGVTLLFLVVTLFHFQQIKQVHLRWLRRWPLLPTGFLLLVIALGLYAMLHEQPVPISRLSLYFAGGLCWLGAALVSEQVLVTDCGIIDGLNRADRYVGWGQILDYFPWQDLNGRTRGFAFLFVDARGRRRRLNLAVPPSRQPAFRQLLTHYLDARFELTVQQCYGKTLEG